MTNEYVGIVPIYVDLIFITWKILLCYIDNKAESWLRFLTIVIG